MCPVGNSWPHYNTTIPPWPWLLAPTERPWHREPGMESLGYGICAKETRKEPIRPFLQSRPTIAGLIPSPSARTARHWHREAGMARLRFGTLATGGRAGKYLPFAHLNENSALTRSHSAPTVKRWPRVEETTLSSCGTWSPDRKKPFPRPSLKMKLMG